MSRQRTRGPSQEPAEEPSQEQAWDPPVVVLVMGVSATGKTSVGRALADRLGVAFEEGDQHHPPANIAKMTAGSRSPTPTGVRG